MFRLLLICFIWCVLASDAYGAKLTLALDPNSTTEPAKYWLFWGTVSRDQAPYLPADKMDLGPHQRNVQFTVDVPTLIPGQIYYFAATAADGSGNQSSFSAEVSKMVPPSVPGNPPPVPGNLRVVPNLGN